MGATPTADWFAGNRDVAEGRFIAEPENENAARVAYVGADIASKLFPAGNVIGNEISIRGLPYRVIGVEAANLVRYLL